MASSRTAWIAAGLVARLLMLAVLAMAVQSRYANRARYDFKDAGYDNDLQSYTYAVAAAVIGMAVSLLQVPVAVYLLFKSKRSTPSAVVLDASTYADIGNIAVVFLLAGMVLSVCATVVSVRIRVRASSDMDDA